MARLYMDEQFPKVVSRLLRSMGHDVLTVQEAGNGNLGIPDAEVLSFAIADNRAVVTIDRYDFIRLHRADSEHCGIIVCTNDNPSKYPIASANNYNNWAIAKRLPSAIVSTAAIAVRFNHNYFKSASISLAISFGSVFEP